MEKLSKNQKIRLMYDFWHRSVMHYAIWYAEVKHQMGEEKAREVLQYAYENAMSIQIKRFAKIFNYNIEDGLPKPLLDLPDENLDELLRAFALNWLAFDGVWFQGVEFKYGMNDAKRCNDSCWAQFAPFEANAIKKILQLGDKPGLAGLKKALQYRMYAYINKQSIHEETENSFVFQMDECRVQVARSRKGLPDYPCKSAGLVEFPRFAEAIDPQIKTECITCPPDKHPKEHYCKWRFYIEDN
ncbi:MAG: hypothetical protein Kow0068_09360 [Marinilabiliales bacterium]